MVWAMGSLCAAHYYRLVTDYGGWHLDFTGYLVFRSIFPVSPDMFLIYSSPLMLIIQKLTMVAYAIHDGRSNYYSSFVILGLDYQ